MSAKRRGRAALPLHRPAPPTPDGGAEARGTGEPGAWPRAGSIAPPGERTWMKSVFHLLVPAHVLLACLMAVIVWVPNLKKVDGCGPFLVALLIMEGLYLFHMVRNAENRRSATDLIMIIWMALLLWEMLTTKLNRMHPVLVPAPENVFQVFSEQYRTLLLNVVSSLELLLTGCVLGISLGVTGGLIVGWTPRLRGVFFPVAQVLTPIPPIVYAPYLVALMPTFRSASALVIFLGIFWPTFLAMIIRVGSIERKILDSAQALNVRGFTMIRRVLWPYVLPSVVANLKITLTTSVMMLVFAEMMGATSGMGYYVINYAHYANYTNVVAGIIVVGVVVTLLSRLVTFVQHKTVPWQ